MTPFYYGCHSMVSAKVVIASRSPSAGSRAGVHRGSTAQRPRSPGGQLRPAFLDAQKNVSLFVSLFVSLSVPLFVPLFIFLKTKASLFCVWKKWRKHHDDAFSSEMVFAKIMEIVHSGHFLSSEIQTHWLAQRLPSTSLL